MPVINTKYGGWNAFANLKIQCKIKHGTFYTQELKISSEKMLKDQKVNVDSMQMVELHYCIKEGRQFQ